MTGGEMIASVETLIDTGKAAATPTESESGTSAAGGAPEGGATAEAAAEAGAAVEERAGTGSTEEAETSSQSSSQNGKTPTATTPHRHPAPSSSTHRPSCHCPHLCILSLHLHRLESPVFLWQHLLTFPIALQTAGQATITHRGKMVSQSRSSTRARRSSSGAGITMKKDSVSGVTCVHSTTEMTLSL